jgi:hypothetical protein
MISGMTPTMLIPETCKNPLCGALTYTEPAPIPGGLLACGDACAAVLERLLLSSTTEHTVIVSVPVALMG